METDIFDALRRERSGIPSGFDPEADIPTPVKALRKAAHDFIEQVRTAQALGVVGARQAGAHPDLNDGARERIRAEQVAAARKAIAAASADLEASWKAYLNEANEVAWHALQPPTALPYRPPHISGDAAAFVDHQRAQVRATEDLARRVTLDRVDRLLDQALASDDMAGIHLLETYSTVRASGDPLLVDVFENEALARPKVSELLVEAIHSARVDRLPDEIQRLSTYANFMSGIDTVRQAIIAEASSDDFFAVEGGGGAIKLSALPQLLGEELASFVGATE